MIEAGYYFPIDRRKLLIEYNGLEKSDSKKEGVKVDYQT
jgi:hypothetical protein